MVSHHESSLDSWMSTNPSVGRACTAAVSEEPHLVSLVAGQISSCTEPSTASSALRFLVIFWGLGVDHQTGASCLALNMAYYFVQHLGMVGWLTNICYRGWNCIETTNQGGLCKQQFSTPIDNGVSHRWFSIGPMINGIMLYQWRWFQHPIPTRDHW